MDTLAKKSKKDYQSKALSPHIAHTTQKRRIKHEKIRPCSSIAYRVTRQVSQKLEKFELKQVRKYTLLDSFSAS